MANREITVGQAWNEAVEEEMRRDKDVFMFGEDIGAFGGCFGMTAGLYNKFPDRIIDTPISEMACANMAIGAAAAGKRPIYEIMFGDFVGYIYAPLTMEMNQTRYVSGNKVKLPIVVHAPQGGVFTNSGCQHSNCVEGWVQNAPGLTVIAPTTPYDMKGLMKAAIRSDNPILFLEHKVQLANKGEVPDEDYVVPIGKADVAKEGTDITIVAWQLMRQFVEAIIPNLEQMGISVELVDPRTIKPFDYETVEASVKKTGRLLIVHEHVEKGGVGQAVAGVIGKDLFGQLKCPIEVMGRADVPIPAGSEEKYLYPMPEQIAAKIIEMVKS